LASGRAPFRYYMGWDSHEIIAHEVAKFSCLEKASVPVQVHALKQHVLRDGGVYTRRTRRQAEHRIHIFALFDSAFGWLQSKTRTLASLCNL
jgi:hypothetical protein